MKKIVKSLFALTIVAGILLSLTACGNKNTSSANSKSGVASNGKSDENKEPVTLTYASWEEDEITEFMVKKFEQEYNYITVDVVKIDQATWEQGLFNLATTGDLPDVFWSFDLASATVNGWTKDITDIYANDEYTKRIPEKMQTAGMYNGKRYGMAIRQYPLVCFLNKTLFEQANVAMPAYNWTLKDVSEIAKKMSIPSQYIFGVSNPIEYYPTIYPCANTAELYHWGFNPKTQDFDFTQWAAGYNDAKALLQSKYAGNPTAEEKQAAYGNPDIWLPETGKLAIQLDYFWTANAMKSTDFTDKGMEWMVYPMPTGSSGRVQTVIDLGAVAETCTNPEEAYLLLKYMTFGSEGWKARKEYYSFKHSSPAALPIADDAEIWDIVKALTPGEDYAAVYNALANASPDSGKWIPGFGAFWAWTWEQDIWGKLERGESKPADVAPQLSKKLKGFYDADMSTINKRG